MMIAPRQSHSARGACVVPVPFAHAHVCLCVAVAKRWWCATAGCRRRFCCARRSGQRAVRHSRRCADRRPLYAPVFVSAAHLTWTTSLHALRCPRTAPAARQSGMPWPAAEAGPKPAARQVAKASPRKPVVIPPLWSDQKVPSWPSPRLLARPSSVPSPTPSPKTKKTPRLPDPNDVDATVGIMVWPGKKGELIVTEFMKGTCA